MEPPVPQVKRSGVTGSDATPEQEWLEDPEFLVFAGEAQLPLGASEEHALGGGIGNLLPKRKEEVKADWDRTVDQIRSLLSGVALDAAPYVLDEVTFELGFSAQGKIVFVAQAGVTATIGLTFKRRRDSGSG
jgi:hypothetical protein